MSKKTRGRVALVSVSEAIARLVEENGMYYGGENRIGGTWGGEGEKKRFKSWRVVEMPKEARLPAKDSLRFFGYDDAGSS